MRTDAVRSEIAQLVRQAPFRPFVLNMENGDRIPVGHPEIIAFNPEPLNGNKKAAFFYVISGEFRYFGTFEAVSSIAVLDRDELSQE